MQSAGLSSRAHARNAAALPCSRGSRGPRSRHGPAAPRAAATATASAAAAAVRPAAPTSQGRRVGGAGLAAAVASPAVPVIKQPRLSYIGTSVAASEGVCTDKAALGARLDAARPPPPRISRGDAEFLAMGLEFVASRDGLKVTELNELFEKVGFPKRDPERLKVALDNTHRLVWVRALKQSRVARVGQLLGFARATSDGVLSATIWDVAVAPAWQRAGLGRALMERLTRQLVDDGIATITLYAEPQVVGLYRKLGFVDDPDGVRGMAFQRKARAEQQQRRQRGPLGGLF